MTLIIDHLNFMLTVDDMLVDAFSLTFGLLDWNIFLVSKFGFSDIQKNDLFPKNVYKFMK